LLSTTSAGRASNGSKEGKGAIKWTRLSCRTFAAVRLQLHALAYNLGNFLRTLATPEPIKDWSLTTLKDKLIKIGAKVVSHGRYVIFQMAEVAIARQMFQEILRRIAELRPQPPPALAERFDVMHSRATERRSASECQGKRPDQAVKRRSDGRKCREPSTLSHLASSQFRKRLPSTSVEGSSGKSRLR
jgi:hypothetical protein